MSVRSLETKLSERDLRAVRAGYHAEPFETRHAALNWQPSPQAIFRGFHPRWEWQHKNERPVTVRIARCGPDDKRRIEVTAILQGLLVLHVTRDEGQQLAGKGKHITLGETASAEFPIDVLRQNLNRSWIGFRAGSGCDEGRLRHC